MAYAGVLQSARHIIAECIPFLNSAMARNPEYKVVVTGHSLAGAVGTLVTLILMSNGNLFSKDKISCFAFGPPPIIPIRLSTENIFCVINGADVVPRLSLSSLERLMVKMEKLDALSRKKITNRWIRWKATSSFFGFNSLNQIQQMAVFEAINSDNLEPGVFPRLFHVGKVFHMRENVLVDCSDDHVIDIESVLADCIDNHVMDTEPALVDCIDDHMMDIELDLGADFIISHLPHTYQRMIATFNLKFEKKIRMRPFIKVMNDEVFTMRSIGTLYSMFANKRGVPRQGNLAPTSEARIVLNSYMAPNNLVGLEGFSHVWVIFIFNRNTNKKKVQAWVDQQGQGPLMFPSKVKPPLMKGASTGLYSTRSPHRPNPIGMTLARIKSVDIATKTVVVAGVDICDETPVIDLKPFVPGDVPQSCPQFAEWVQSEDQIQWQVTFDPEFQAKLIQKIETGATSFYKCPEKLTQAIVEVLQLDIRAVYQGRGNEEAELDSESQCVVDNLQIFFVSKSKSRILHVTDVLPYDKTVLPPV